MDTRLFLETILPSAGFKFVTEWVARPEHANGGVMIHHPIADLDEAVDKIRQIDAKGHNVYYAMASYKEVQYKTITTKNGREFTYAVGRRQDNAHSVKCLWQDWDVGKADSGISYSSRAEAVVAIKTYLAATGLPTPLIINSGYGIHTYWVFTEEVSAREWERIACLQRVIMRHVGVKFDTSRDKDCASVLRPVGSHNYKAGQAPRAVTVVKEGAVPLPPQEYRRILQGYIDKHGLTAEVLLPSYMNASGGNLSAFGAVEYPPSYAENVVQHCNQIRQFSQDGGASEPIWYACLGVTKHLVDGEKWAHEWSARHEDYSFAHTQMKLEQWPHGPATCDKFREINPEGCADCPHKCSSPIQLGLDEQTEAPSVDPVAPTVPEPEAPAEEITPEAVDADKVPHGWPEGYGYNKSADRMYRKVRNPDTGVVEQLAFASPLFYPVGTIYQEDGTHVFRMHMHVRGKIKEFDLPTKYVADAKSLRSALAANLIHVIDGNQAVFFMNSYMNNLRATKDVVNTYNQFGWKHDFEGFLIGSHLITATEIKKVEVSKSSITDATLLNAFGVRGTVGEWVEGVEYLYNHPKCEPYQMAIGVAFGGILGPFVQDELWKGIPYALTSKDSGFGKSTVAKHALNIYGNSSNTEVSRFTVLALSIRMSNLGHLPALFDEITNSLVLPQHLSDGLYSLSHGKMKVGGTQSGKQRDQLPPWCVPCIMTGNVDIQGRLEGYREVDPEPTKMRVFEVDVQYYGAKEHMEQPDGKEWADRLMHCYGAVGVEWIRFVMKNRAEIETQLRAVYSKIYAKLGAYASAERYYCHLVTCAYVGLYYARKLGFVRFDLKNLMQWALRHIEYLRMRRAETSDAPEDLFSHMMSDLSRKILVTKRYGALDGRSKHGAEHPLVPFHGDTVEGRLAVGGDGDRPKLLLSRRSVSQWCSVNGVSFQTFKRELAAQGLLKFGMPGVDKKTGVCRAALGKGVVGYTQLGATPCLEFDAEAGAKVVSANSETVVQLYGST